MGEFALTDDELAVFDPGPAPWAKSRPRICYPSGRRPRPKQPGARSRFKWVSPTPSGRWTACVHKGGVAHYVGTFATEEQAARAADRKVVELFGAGFGGLNFPGDA
jgi:hypothetical protein